VSSLVVALSPGADAAEARARIQRTLDSAAPALVVRTWQEVAGPLRDAGRIGTVALAMGYALVVVIIVLGFLDAVLIVVLGRTREMGIQLALGAGRGRVLASLLLEMSTLSIASAAAGVALAWLTGTVLGAVGIPAANRAMVFAFGGPRLHAVVGGAEMLLGFAAGAAAGPLATLWPALRACRLDPVRALVDR
jgi:putative ABC transport system permease protein